MKRIPDALCDVVRSEVRSRSLLVMTMLAVALSSASSNDAATLTSLIVGAVAGQTALHSTPDEWAPQLPTKGATGRLR